MNSNIERLIKTRQYLIDQIASLTNQELNKIPEGFNNNIIWNFGHMIAAQQGVCYLRSGNKTIVDESCFNLYKPGTKPTKIIEETEVEKLKETAISSLAKLAVDYKAGIFKSYPSWSTRYGIEITNIKDAIKFLLYHDGMHSGAILALKKLVSS